MANKKVFYRIQWKERIPTPEAIYNGWNCVTHTDYFETIEELQEFFAKQFPHSLSMREPWSFYFEVDAIEPKADKNA